MDHFRSSALGSLHTYRASVFDRAQLILELDNPLVDGGQLECCEIHSPHYDAIWHSKAQLQQVLLDFKAAINRIENPDPV